MIAWTMFPWIVEMLIDMTVLSTNAMFSMQNSNTIGSVKEGMQILRSFHNLCMKTESTFPFPAPLSTLRTPGLSFIPVDAFFFIWITVRTSKIAPNPVILPLFDLISHSVSSLRLNSFIILEKVVILVSDVASEGLLS